MYFFVCHINYCIFAYEKSCLTSKRMQIAEIRTVAKSLPPFRCETHKSLILSYSEYLGRFSIKNAFHHHISTLFTSQVLLQHIIILGTVYRHFFITSTLTFCRFICCKDNANERNESLLSNCRVQLIFCKDTRK